MDGVELDFEEDALMAIASLAIERNTGARGLRSIMEELMMPLMYDIPSSEDLAQVTITPQAVLEKAEPKYIEKICLSESSSDIKGELSESNE